MKTREEAKKWINEHWDGLVEKKELAIVLNRYFKKYPYKKRAAEIGC